MRPPSEPAINRDDPKKYFIYWNHDVPVSLWPNYGRKRVRIKKYDDINRYKGDEREQYAESRRQVWKYALTHLKYNPFEEELAELDAINERRGQLQDQIQARQEQLDKKVEASMSVEVRRKAMPIGSALEDFMKSRRARKLEPTSISSYNTVVEWLLEAFKELGHSEIKVGDVKHIHLTSALDYVAEDREWSATTINKAMDFLLSIFNWFEVEEYILRNPSKGKFSKLPTNKSKHRWYDRDTKDKVVTAIKGANNLPLLRACQFTYWLLIRSKKELRMLQIGDIDQTLKRIRFRSEVSKNNEEVYRDYPPEFQLILDEMNLSGYPKGYYVFGSGDGTPGEKMCGHNYFSKMFMAIKTKLELSMDYTIYGFKHTRIVHEMMKGTDGYMISYMARHNDRKSTEDYKRDYDITLINKYLSTDLSF